MTLVCLVMSSVTVQAVATNPFSTGALIQENTEVYRFINP
jgi:hypothetical protein